ncbi:hypothetical protein N9L68_07420 [bacterium]|nr:hypothetical protein [bacterium]
MPRGRGSPPSPLACSPLGWMTPKGRPSRMSQPMIGILMASLVSTVVAVGSFPDFPLDELKLRSSRVTCSDYYYDYYYYYYHYYYYYFMIVCIFILLLLLLLLSLSFLLLINDFVHQLPQRRVRAVGCRHDDQFAHRICLAGPGTYYGHHPARHPGTNRSSQWPTTCHEGLGFPGSIRRCGPNHQLGYEGGFARGRNRRGVWGPYGYNFCCWICTYNPGSITIGPTRATIYGGSVFFVGMDQSENEQTLGCAHHGRRSL